MRKCNNCHNYYTPQRSTSQYCSEGCNKKAKRKRRITKGECYRCGIKVNEINPVTGDPFHRCIRHRNLHKKANIKWHKEHIEERKNFEKNRANYHKCWRKRKNKEAKKTLLKMYGSECQCCGESELKFLTLDHINGDGLDHRRKVGSTVHQYYGDACKAYRPDLFQILCMNCNWATGKFGQCPHKDVK